MDFGSSTHCKWILTLDELTEKLLKTNKAGIANVLQLRRQHDEPIDGLEPLTAHEEGRVVQFYTQFLLRDAVVKLCPRKVCATAIIFLRRFYLNHSCMEHDIMRITLTCLYVAGKACEHYMDAQTVVARTVGKSVRADEILLLETDVLQALRFELVVYHPYAIIDAMVEELRIASEHEAAIKELVAKQPDALNRVHKLAYGYTDSIMRSNAPLVMRPQRQALCAVFHALTRDKLTPEVAMERYLAKARQRRADSDQQDPAAVLTEFKAVLKQGDDLAAEGFKLVSKEEAAPLDLKMRQFNPALKPGSSLYKKLHPKPKKKRKAREEAD